MNATLYQYQHLSDELSELLEAFELKLNRSRERLSKAQYFEDEGKVEHLLEDVRQWKEMLGSREVRK
ncbi:MAG: hypothetical protein GC180_01940 [Bacteroidetes bacterium]|nr:hypothetical protein [Bacteroidota bacterium]